MVCERRHVRRSHTHCTTVAPLATNVMATIGRKWELGDIVHQVLRRDGSTRAPVVHDSVMLIGVGVSERCV